MKVIYLGTPDFAVAPLVKLKEECADKVEIIAVITNPDRPVGRKQVLTPCPVKVKATEYGLPVFSYDKIRLEGVEDIKKLNPDLMITCAFGQILSQEILDIPKYGVINIHASLLPKYRGASPIHYAILNGESKTGVTIMKTDIGIDTGDMLIQREIEIGADETCGQLFDRLSMLGADCIKDAVALILNGTATYKKQDDNLATLTKMIKKEHALIDWSEDNKRVYDRIRAFNPSPIAYTYLNGEPLKIHKAELSNGQGNVGEVIDNDGCLEIACGSGSIKILTLQKAGGKAMSVTDFLRGNKPSIGSKLG